MRRVVVFAVLLSIPSCGTGRFRSCGGSTEPQTSEAIGQTGSVSPLESAVVKYVLQYGIKSFLDECYNLFGTSNSTIISEDNIELSLALGLPFQQSSLAPQLAAWDILGVGRVQELRQSIAEIFERRGAELGLSEIQRAFVNWHFSAPRDYALNLQSGSDDFVVGWNKSYSITNKQSYRIVTFGLVGCHAVIALNKAGEAFLSHYDTSPFNQRQIDDLGEFLKDYPDSEIYIIGHYAESVADAIRKQLKTQQINLFSKVSFTERSFTIVVERQGGETTIRTAKNWLSASYIDSITNKFAGQFYPYGRASEIYPPADKRFFPANFKPLSL